MDSPINMPQMQTWVSNPQRQVYDITARVDDLGKQIDDRLMLQNQQMSQIQAALASLTSYLHESMARPSPPPGIQHGEPGRGHGFDIGAAVRAASASGAPALPTADRIARAQRDAAHRAASEQASMFSQAPMQPSMAGLPASRPETIGRAAFQEETSFSLEATAAQNRFASPNLHASPAAGRLGNI